MLIAISSTFISIYSFSRNMPACEFGSPPAYRCAVSPIWKQRKNTSPGTRSSVTSVVTEVVGSIKLPHSTGSATPSRCDRMAMPTP